MRARVSGLTFLFFVSSVTGYRTGIVIRARFVEDLVTEQADHGVGQHVILGAGLDIFAQRRPEIAGRLQTFEVDRPGAQEWKRQRLIELGYGIPKWLHFVPVDFEVDDTWPDHLVVVGFDSARPAVVASTGVSMYVTKEAVASPLKEVATLATGSTFAMTFLLPPKPVKRTKSSGRSSAEKEAPSSRKRFTSFFSPKEMLVLAREAGFRRVRHIAGTTLPERYLSDRMDSLPSPSAEEMLVATT